jgi:hypothetical protein
MAPAVADDANARALRVNYKRVGIGHSGDYILRRAERNEVGNKETSEPSP